MLREELKRKFMEQLKDVRERSRSVTREITRSVIIALHIGFCFKEIGTRETTKSTKQQFVASAKAITKPAQHPDKMLGFIEAAQFYKPT